MLYIYRKVCKTTLKYILSVLQDCSDICESPATIAKCHSTCRSLNAILVKRKYDIIGWSYFWLSGLLQCLSSRKYLSGYKYLGSRLIYYKELVPKEIVWRLKDTQLSL